MQKCMIGQRRYANIHLPSVASSHKDMNMGIEKDVKKLIMGTKGSAWHTQKELATHAGVDQSQISRFISGKTYLNSNNLFTMLDALGARVVAMGGDVNFAHGDKAAYSRSACVNPEAAQLDKMITALRQAGSVDAAIRDALLAQVEAMFSKNQEGAEDTEERKQAS